MLHCCFRSPVGTRCLAYDLAFSLLMLLQERTPHNDNDFVFATDACELKVCRLSACEAWRWRELVGAGVV